MMKRLIVTAMATVLMASTVIAQQKPAAPAGKGVPALQGVWGVLTINGQSIPDGGMSMTLTITGENYAQANADYIDMVTG